MSHKIKPCPFCGGAIDYVNVDQERRDRNPRGARTNGPDHYAFRCLTCDYELKYYHSNSQLRQIENFNRRSEVNMTNQNANAIEALEKVKEWIFKTEPVADYHIIIDELNRMIAELREESK
jgi:hypothetical protein